MSRPNDHCDECDEPLVLVDTQTGGNSRYCCRNPQCPKREDIVHLKIDRGGRIKRKTFPMGEVAVT